MKVIKRDGTEVPFNIQKITDAIMAANDKEHGQDRVGIDKIMQIAVIIEARCERLARAVSVEEIQDMVVDELDKAEAYRLARHYSEYRYQHALIRKQNSTDGKVLSLLRHDNELAKQENAKYKQGFMVSKQIY